MLNFTKREGIVILVFVIVIGFIFIYPMYANRGVKLVEADGNNMDYKRINGEILDYSNVNEKLEDELDTPNTIIVHIDGEVMKPGVIELNEGSRVIDAINIAGGLTEYADEKRINLAKKIYDEEKIYIPKTGEETSEIQTVSFNQDNNSNSNQAKININIATKEELQKLPGIGPVLAERIIEYRQTNRFSKIDDIKKVSGIGDKKFEAIKDYIVVK